MSRVYELTANLNGEIYWNSVLTISIKLSSLSKQIATEHMESKL